MKPSVIVDTMGLFCPMPIIKTSEAMRVLDEGAMVELISDDPAIEHDMPAWCDGNGHKIESVTREGSVFRFLVRKAVSKPE